jgi:hypothetical protein
MHWKEDLRSKLADGIGIGLFLVIISFTFELLTQLVYRFLGRPGALIFALIFMAGSVASLEESLRNRHPENQRVLMGMVGGILGWLVTEISNQIGSLTLYSDAGIILFIFVTLIVWTLWRRGLPLGAKLYMGTLLLSWLTRVFLAGQQFMEAWTPIFIVVYQIIGYLGLLAGLFVCVWIIFRSQTRFERLRLALVLWFSILLGTVVLLG